ncbi:NAD(P)H-dependent oxidoreductase [Streptomyces murinus]|uniref:NAD(P)H-dependent oxidoreductase n=1 Tax=Streptomyces murinus TaxID=33900 RepID=UPI00211444E3|nr:NAD(P)H-dependent oxidoreductase [Streptomyces murinus]
MDRSFLFLLASARPGGNSELLARAAAEQLPAATERRWLDLARLALPDFVDTRHAETPWPEQENEETLRQAKWLSTPDPGFRAAMAGRALWGVTAMAHREEAVARPLELTLHHSAAYMGMNFGGVLLGNGTRPGQVLDDERAIVRAKTFFAGEPRPARFPEEGRAAGRSRSPEPAAQSLSP